MIPVRALRVMRALFGFTAKLPVRGSIHIETLLAAQLAKPMIRTWFDARRVSYGAFPIDEPNALGFTNTGKPSLRASFAPSCGVSW